MGAILSLRVKDDGKIIFELSVAKEESQQLQGHVDNVHIFSENVADIEANISQRGKNGATKYFLIPKILRKGLKFDANTKCQKIETKTKTIFIFVVDKLIPIFLGFVFTKYIPLLIYYYSSEFYYRFFLS